VVEVGKEKKPGNLLAHASKAEGESDGHKLTLNQMIISGENGVDLIVPSPQ